MRLEGALVLGGLGLAAACSGGLSDSGDTRDGAAPTMAADAGAGDARDGAAPTMAADAGTGDARDGAAPTMAADAGTGTCGCALQDIYSVQWSDVGCFCAAFQCPDLASLKVLIESCPPESPQTGLGPTLSSGCGLIQYEWQGGGVTTYQFDALTGAMVAAFLADDSPFVTHDQSCSANAFSGGTLTDLTACPDFSICLACKTPADVPACAAP